MNVCENCSEKDGCEKDAATLSICNIAANNSESPLDSDSETNQYMLEKNTTENKTEKGDNTMMSKKSNKEVTETEVEESAEVEAPKVNKVKKTLSEQVAEKAAKKEKKADANEDDKEESKKEKKANKAKKEKVAKEPREESGVHKVQVHVAKNMECSKEDVKAFIKKEGIEMKDSTIGSVIGGMKGNVKVYKAVHNLE